MTTVVMHTSAKTIARPQDTPEDGGRSCQWGEIWWTIVAPMRGGETRVVPFFVQIKCDLGKSYAVANAIADAEIASEIYSTAGEFDLLVKFYVEQGTDIGHFVNERVQTIAGIKDTLTIITFKAF